MCGMGLLCITNWWYRLGQKNRGKLINPAWTFWVPYGKPTVSSLAGACWSYCKRLRRLSMVPKRCDIQYENHLADQLLRFHATSGPWPQAMSRLRLSNPARDRGERCKDSSKNWKTLKRSPLLLGWWVMMSHDESWWVMMSHDESWIAMVYQQIGISAATMVIKNHRIFVEV